MNPAREEFTSPGQYLLYFLQLREQEKTRLVRQMNNNFSDPFTAAIKSLKEKLWAMENRPPMKGARQEVYRQLLKELSPHVGIITPEVGFTMSVQTFPKFQEIVQAILVELYKSAERARTHREKILSEASELSRELNEITLMFSKLSPTHERLYHMHNLQIARLQSINNATLAYIHPLMRARDEYFHNPSSKALNDYLALCVELYEDEIGRELYGTAHEELESEIAALADELWLYSVMDSE